MPPPFKVKAIYDYSSPHDDDLNFSNGQIITVTDDEDEDWYTGHYADASGANQEGLFPRNFVEKYEPEIPSRPARPVKSKKEAEPVVVEPAETLQTAPAPVREEQESEDVEEAAPSAAKQASSPLLSAPQPSNPHQPPLSNEKSPPTQPAPDFAQKPAAAKQPPQVAAKPASGSFKDRIAAFNKPAAPPITPYKPSGGTGGSTGFIKKPFVAPPPSKNAYVPPPREPPPQKVYRREEEPIVQETEPPVRAQENEERGAEEDRPKPTSLKDRIALLQKQQLEQAARHSEAAQKKEKPKRPPKKRIDSQEQALQAEEAAGTQSLPTNTTDPVSKKSVDFAPEEAASIRDHQDRQAIPPTSMATPPQPSRELMSDTNDADYSAADDTEDADETSTGREDTGHEVQARARLPSSSGRHPLSTEEAAPTFKEQEVQEDENTEGEEEEEEEEVDPEVKRRMEIRERMAKMSGGMGMMGMFGPPGGVPASGSTKKSRPSMDRQRSGAGTSDEPSNAAQAPPVPIMALPGMSKMKGPEPSEIEAEPESINDNEQTPTNLSASKQRAPDVVPDIEEVEPEQPRQASHGMRPQGMP